MSLLLLTRLPLLPAPPPEELSEENPILAYERLMASLRPPSNPSTNTTYQERAVREIVPRAPASFTPVDVNSNSSTGMRVYEIAQNTEQRYTGTETWGPTGGAFQQSWEERRAQMDFVAMSGCGSSVGGVAGAVAAAIASGHLGGSAAGESGATYSRLEAALAGGYAQMSTIQPGFGPAETSGFTRPSSRGRFQGAGTSRGGPGGATGSPSDTFGVQITARPLGTSGGTAAPLRAGGPPPSGTLSGRKSSGGSESSQGRGRRKKT